ncbi:MAG: hypothetical protein WD906_02680 [Anaerolineales bacterium]
MTIFLIEYDRGAGKVISMMSFPDIKRKEAEYTRLSRELSLKLTGSDREVVLLEAANEEALRRTHRRYFDSLRTITEAARA